MACSEQTERSEVVGNSTQDAGGSTADVSAPGDIADDTKTATPEDSVTQGNDADGPNTDDGSRSTGDGGSARIAAVYVDDLQDGKAGAGTQDDPYRDLQYAIEQAPESGVVHIAAGTYTATPQPYADPGCGNCSDIDFPKGSEATRGFYVHNKAVQLKGAGAKDTVLVTGAGYGLLFENAGVSTVADLKVTGGKRDADGKATDAGIVVIDTELTVERVAVVGNDDLYDGPLPDPVVGIGGIFGREGSILTVRDSVIEDNSWDGITLYRGYPGKANTAPVGTVENCRIGCTSQCVSKRGRGAGIGVTWGARLTAVSNVVHHYWKGIGSFGTSNAFIYNNLVVDQVGWGIIAAQQSKMVAVNNVVTRNGTTGMAAWDYTASGSFLNNIVYKNGTSKDEWVGKKTGVWLNALPMFFEFKYNLVFENADFDVCEGGFPNKEPCKVIKFVGENGNVTGDPLFMGPDDFHLKAGSPAIDAGDPTMKDKDDSRSDMGVFGGPWAPGALPSL